MEESMPRPFPNYAVTLPGVLSLALLMTACAAEDSGALSTFGASPSGTVDVVGPERDGSPVEDAGRADGVDGAAPDAGDDDLVDPPADVGPPVACDEDEDCDDGLSCTEDQCTAMGHCAAPVAPGRCLIQEVCHDKGDPNPANACLGCRPGVKVNGWSPADGFACDDGDPCTQGDLCEGGACLPGAPDPCDDGNPCTADHCAPGEGCRHEGICECQSDDDCAALDDGDLCTGALRCDTSTFPFSCQVDPDTVVHCATTSDTACRVTQCVPATGVCVQSATNEHGACDDGDGCTVDDTCTAGACVGTPCVTLGEVCREGACAEVVCGDGWIDPGETCDDGDDEGGDGCSAVCQISDGYTCAGEPSVCTASPVDVFEYGFDSDLPAFSGTDGWQSSYCDDPWTTALNGGVFPTTDDGCGIPNDQCSWNYKCDYQFGYWTQGGQCIESDPFDNHLTFGDTSWTDYTLTAQLRNDDDDSVGVTVRYANSGQFYLFMMAHDQVPEFDHGCNLDYSGAALIRVQDSNPELLAVDPATFELGAITGVRVTVQGASIKAWVDWNGDGNYQPSELLFDVVDPDALPAGKVGLWAFENGATGDDFDPCSAGGCWFDNVKVVLE
jgi:cysteine-rich repeat protein